MSTFMDCERYQEAIFDALRGVEAEILDREIRGHLETCASCRQAMPGVAEELVAINHALVPEPTEEGWKAIDARVLAGIREEAQNPKARIAAPEPPAEPVVTASPSAPTVVQVRPAPSLTVEGSEDDFSRLLVSHAIISKEQLRKAFESRKGRNDRYGKRSDRR